MRSADDCSNATFSGNGSAADSPAGTDAAAVGEYTGLAKLKVFVSVSAINNKIYT